MPRMIMTTRARFLLSSFGSMLFILFNVSSTISFPISTNLQRTSSPFVVSKNAKFTDNPYLPRPAPWNHLYSGAQDANEDDAAADALEKKGDSVDVAGILGAVASIVVLRSEFVLKTTGCGLPAGPFGIVGAIEGVSYLGVVATCATAIVDNFSSDDSSSSKERTTAVRRAATSLSFLAVVVGIAVLVFQLTDYGYIPNAVPMEGGMCQ